MSHTFRKKITAIATATCILIPLAHSGPISVVSAEKALVSTGSYTYSKVEAPTLKPVWSTSIAILKNNPTYQTVTAIAENGKVFALQRNNKLVALNASTGQKLWEFGSDLAPLFVSSNGYIYGLTKGGSLYAATEAGKKVWTAAISLPNASSIQRIGSTIYVTEATQLAAVEASTGKVKWKIAENSNNFTGLIDILEADGVIVRGYISQGAITTSGLVAYDKQTGKKLWDLTRQQSPLVVKDGLLYSIKNMEMLEDDPVNRKINVSVFSLRTGVLKGERLYKWTDTENIDGVFRSGGSYGSAFLDGNDFYVFQGNKFVKYDFWNYSAEGKPLKEWHSQSNKGDFPLNQVLHQRMLYTNYNSGLISALKLESGQAVTLNHGENPVVQTDIFGNVVYSGQSDGLFHAYDLLTLKPIFTVNTGSRDFLPSLKTGGMLIIRTDNKLLAIKLPTSIK